MTDYVRVELINFPTFKVDETVTLNSDGGYTVFINANLSHEAQRTAYLHAMSHIFNQDFNNYDVQKIEARVHRKEVII